MFPNENAMIFYFLFGFVLVAKGKKRGIEKSFS
jgi:hypothetical protein